MAKKRYECNYGSKGADLDIGRPWGNTKEFLITLSGSGFEASRFMSREDMEDMISWVKEAINADQG